MSLLGSVQHRRDEDDVVDLTGEDAIDAIAPPPNKIRKSTRRGQIKQNFRAYLNSLSPVDRQLVQECYLHICEEKRDILARRNGIRTEESQYGTSLETLTKFLNNGLVLMEDLEHNILTKMSNSGDAKSWAERARKIGMGIRSRLESFRSDNAIQQLENRAIHTTRAQVLNDPVYRDARSRSLVTANPTETKSLYAPPLTPDNANLAILREAARNPINPGLLPDGRYIRQEYIPILAKQGDQDPQGNTSIGEASYNSLSNGSASTAQAYEKLVDLALNEAQPLDMPNQMVVQNLPHQRQGLGWLVRAEHGHNKGGILADDMGLGKTIQAIALLFANPPKEHEPHAKNRMVLIVCPVALIATWAEELKNRVKEEFSFRVYIHHRSTNKDYTEFANIIEQNADIVICSYPAVSREHKILQKSLSDPESITPRRFPLFQIQWHRIILDEAHLIKNKDSQTSLAVRDIKAQYRIAITGTPMQNKLTELFPLIRFLRIDPYCHWTEFSKLLPATGSSEFTQYESQKSLAAFLSATMLRRKKDTMIEGRKIIDNLPQKHIKDVYVYMQSTELQLYKTLEERIREEFKRKDISSRQISSLEDGMTYSNMLVHLLRLRQFSCHSFLSEITKRATGRSFWGKNSQTKKAIRQALVVSSVVREKALESSNQDRICYDCEGPASVMAETSVMPQCGHIFCSECSQSRVDNVDADSEIICPCGIMSRFLANLEILDVINTNSPQTDDEVLELLLERQSPRVEQQRRIEDTRKNKLGNLKRGLRGNLFDSTLFSDEEDELYIEDKPSVDAQHESMEISGNNDPYSPNNSLSNEEDLPDPMKERIDIHQIAKLFKVGNIFNDGWKSSAKVESCIDTLRTIWTESPNDKVIVFTSFTSLIDLLTIPLEAAGVYYECYTGKMNIRERNEVLEKFKTGRCKVLLASLKAGNVGLTLTQANRVIIMEPFWNPYVEEQAQDRVHRIGQSREVTIYRLRVKDSVEDRIVTLQDSKRAIIESALDNSAKTRSQGLSRLDLMYALGLRQRPRPPPPELRRAQSSDAANQEHDSDIELVSTE